MKRRKEKEKGEGERRRKERRRRRRREGGGGWRRREDEGRGGRRRSEDERGGERRRRRRRKRRGRPRTTTRRRWRGLSARPRGGCGPTASAWPPLHLVLTSLFLVLSTAIALSVHNLGIVLSVVGATGSTTVSYILPGGCYFLLFADEPGTKRSLALAQCALGLTLVPLMLLLILQRS